MKNFEMETTLSISVSIAVLQLKAGFFYFLPQASKRPTLLLKMATDDCPEVSLTNASLKRLWSTSPLNTPDQRLFRRDQQVLSAGSGLPDFSRYNIPKRGKSLPNDYKITKCP
jgi:hypothetical protein